MSKELDAFYAGLVVARGQVRIKRLGRSGSHAELTLRAEDPRIVEGAHKYFGVGKVDFYNPAYNPDKCVYTWSVRGGAAREVLERITPYLVGMTGDMARDVLHAYEEREVSNDAA